MIEAGATSRARTALQHGVVVHYHEVGLKGRNRGFFERRLIANLRDAMAGCEHEGVQVLSGRLLVDTRVPPSEALLGRVGRTFGVAAYAPCVVVPPEIPAMTDAALDLVGQGARTFAVAARRATKELPLTSRDINVQLGAAIQRHTGAGVNLDAPEVKVHVEVVGGRAILYVDRRVGPGGLPVGVSGRVMALLSGGIDSPVATYRLLKRGASVSLCHFHSAPFTDRSSTRKATELAGILTDWQGDTPLHLVPIGKAQQEIVLVAPPALRVVLYRRLMVRIASALAAREGAKALVTGDSLGQVASQTLENMLCVDDASPMPLLRPLIGADKQEIINEAEGIGTYALSILPYEDCCTLFVPKSPATRARMEDCREAEAHLDVEALVAACLDDMETVRVRRTGASDRDGG